jgi:hypothetical protein
MLATSGSSYVPLSSFIKDIVERLTTTALYVPRFAELFITLAVRYPALIFFSVEDKVDA